MGKIKRVFPVYLLLLFFLSCNSDKKEEEKTGQEIFSFDIEEIKERGKLIAVTDYNSTNYFIYRGQPMGYQFDMLRQLADYLGIKLEVIVNNQLDKSFDYLQEGKCDIIAINLGITKERKNIVSFTQPHTISRQVLVQRKPENWHRLSNRELDERLIRNQLDLAGKTIYVPKESTFATRLKNLSDEIGDTIHIVEVADETEQLIEKVVEREIDYTVADENVAKVNLTYYPELDIKTAVSFPQYLAWGVRKDAEKLKEEIDKWLVQFKKTTRYANIYNKYYRNQRSALIVTSDYYVINTGKISAYDEIVKKASGTIGWDWRLISSLIYQESRFNPVAESWAGAYGLMQMMPTTGERFGVDKTSSPAQNIYGGVKFIKWLENRLKRSIKDPEERVKFVLASYNVGLGHVQDAQRLTLKYGKNPNIWEDNVEIYLKKKSEPKYFRDPVVKYGYCRGDEPYNYVREILDRFDHYKNIIPKDKEEKELQALR